MSDAEKRREYDASSSFDDFTNRSGFKSNFNFDDVGSFFSQFGSFFNNDPSNGGGSGNGFGFDFGNSGFGNSGFDNMFSQFGNSQQRQPNMNHRQHMRDSHHDNYNSRGSGSQAQGRTQGQGSQGKGQIRKQRVYIDLNDITKDFDYKVNSKHTIHIDAGIPDGTIINKNNIEYEIYCIDSKNIWQRGTRMYRSDLSTTIDITLEEALFGFKYSIKSIMNENLNIEIDNINQLVDNNFEIKFKDKGLPKYNKRKNKNKNDKTIKRGDAIVKINVLFPSLTNKQLNDLKNSFYPGLGLEEEQDNKDKKDDKAWTTNKKYNYAKMRSAENKRKNKEKKRNDEKLEKSKNNKNNVKRKNQFKEEKKNKNRKRRDNRKQDL